MGSHPVVVAQMSAVAFGDLPSQAGKLFSLVRRYWRVFLKWFHDGAGPSLRGLIAVAFPRIQRANAPASKAGAALLFEVIANAHERKSLLVTTHLPFENLTEVLGNERLTGAALGRLTHRGHMLETSGESYRLQEATRRRRTPRFT